MVLDYCLYTNQGERPVNEDCIGNIEQNGCFAFSLCDGLGGHGKGEIASKTAVDAMLACVKQNGYNATLVAEAFEKANEALLAKQQESSVFKEMKTTGTFLVLKDGFADWGHIGDSRINYFHKTKFVKRTLDHSVPQMLVETGEIKEKDIRRHEDRSRLLRCLPWTGKKYDVDEQGFAVQSGDAFILMTDGFWDWVDEKMMHKCLKKGKNAKETADLLVNLAFKYGSGKNMDNLSLIVVKIV